MTTAPPTTPAAPPLLKTHQEARLLWEAKDWKLTGVAAELGEKPDLKRFHITHTKLSKKSRAGRPSPIEPEVAAAVEALETRPGCERQVEIVIRGLLALHGVAPVPAPAPVATRSVQGDEEAAPAPVEDVATVLKELRDALPGELVAALEAKASARDGKLVEVLEEKAGARESTLIDTLEERAGAREGRLLRAVAKLGQLTWRHLAIAAGVGGVVVAASVAASLAPLLARATPPPVQNIFVVGREGGDPALWAEAESYLAMSMWGEKKRPLDQEVPKQTLPRQKVAPCDEGLGQEAIYGNCWAWQGAVKPPCGRLFRHGDKCYAPVGAFSWPADPGPDR